MENTEEERGRTAGTQNSHPGNSSPGTETRRAPGSSGAVHNSAFTVYDPPLERDDSRLILRVTKHLAAFPWTDARKYKDVVNSDQFTINKKGNMFFSTEEKVPSTEC